MQPIGLLVKCTDLSDYYSCFSDYPYRLPTLMLHNKLYFVRYSKNVLQFRFFFSYPIWVPYCFSKWVTRYVTITTLCLLHTYKKIQVKVKPKYPAVTKVKSSMLMLTCWHEKIGARLTVYGFQGSLFAVQCTLMADERIRHCQLLTKQTASWTGSVHRWTY